MDSGTLLSGRYRLDRPIDSGAMGAVWSARDERLDREVAVKILLPGVEDDGERFEREAKTLASLKGPNYVEVYDFGEEVDGDRTVPFLVMELVEGVSLARLLAREERLDPARAMRIVADAADALDAAHRKGVVHRDVKPANLLVDAEDRVRVVDFGISLLADRTRLTDSREVLGTVPYVSPERLRNQDVTGKSDLYSLGAVAYECLAGTPPFPAQDPMAVIHSHLYEEPPALPGSVPPPIAAVVARSLRKDPDERWESGEAFAAACRSAATGEIAVPAEPGPAESVPPEVAPGSVPPGAAPDGERRSRKRLALLVVATVLAAAVFGFVVWSPWSGDGTTGAEADGESSLDSAENAAGEPGEEGTTGPASPSASESAAAQEGESAAEGGGDGEDGGQDDGGGSEGDSGDTGGDEDTETERPVSGSGTVPDVTGMTTFAARDHLYGLGFTNVVPSQGYFVGEHAVVHCDVGIQNPQAGSTADYGSQITLTYNYEDEHNGGGTSCEW
ncbi:serine/threonine protein kinase [Glycomyces terrestris]|uniref:non-specific serine/threonine protein kinase n=1 Tax=Glycomyces terrestris TaxID=2493553 RepID=A0A426V4R1_9ACTN|nr:serine/threonine protein kinase [Glycomyces terrestris]RRS01808.1 serine/threonine protein kinase [Glycomyces terrestris]